MELVVLIYILYYDGNMDMIVALINDHQTIICTAIGWEYGRLGFDVYIGMKWGWIVYILVDGNEMYIGNIDGISGILLVI